MARTLIIIGMTLLVAGLLWLGAERLGLSPGRLPGDITIQRENFRIYFPITTMIVVSIILSLVLWLFNR